MKNSLSQLFGNATAEAVDRELLENRLRHC
jgi:hypothetical protein